MRVDLVTHTPDPLAVLYRAFRACYSAEAANDLDAEGLGRDELEDYLTRRLVTGHTQPLEQVAFVFAISGVSRAFSHQFVRHRVGISYAQQSQRYVEGVPELVIPPSIVEDAVAVGYFEKARAAFAGAYWGLIQAGIPAEDARFVLPAAAETSMQVSINMAALLHMADRRLCTRAQWEVRRVVAAMRAEVMRTEPFLGRMLQPYCGERRAGFCDEEESAWRKCVIGRVRPHKSAGGNSAAIGEVDLA